MVSSLLVRVAVRRSSVISASFARWRLAPVQASTAIRGGNSGVKNRGSVIGVSCSIEVTSRSPLMSTPSLDSVSMATTFKNKLAERGLSKAQLVVPVEVLDADGINALIKQQDRVLTF